MATEQQGVSPATAGGALPVPEPFRRMMWIAAEDIANAIGCTVVEGKPRGYGAPAPIGEPGTGYWIPNADGRCSELNQGGKQCGLACGHAGEHSTTDGVFRWDKWDRPDPRDAEIERLRDRVSQLSDEKRLLRERLDRINEQLRDHAEGRSRRYSEVRDRIYRALGEEPPVVLGLWADLVKQVDRLIDVLDVEVRQHDQTKADMERANEQAIKATNERNDLRAERDRLRAELDLIGEQRPKFQPEQRVRIGNGETFGTVRTTLERYTVEIDGVHFLVDLPPAFLAALPDDTPAAPRRWVAGDPEPEVGTTVDRGVKHGGIWTLRENGTWHSEECADDCRSAGPRWPDMIRDSGGELVEVVSTDGD